MEIEPVDELVIPETHPRVSKYRATLDEFMASDMKRGKITCSQLAEAEYIQKGLKRYRRLEEPIVIERRGNIIWLVKLN